jgi:orotidine-5'-phosphate decarboxylase
MTANPLCLALDLENESRIDQMVESTRDYVGMYKVGLTTIYGAGIDYIARKDWPVPLFVDAKLHDIPAQIEGAIEGLRRLKPALVTVHASGGAEMLRAAVKATQGEFDLVAVSVLTSLSNADLFELGWSESSEDLVIRLAEFALDAGVRGLVCSPLESASVRARFGASDSGGPLIVTPGIRPHGSTGSDQRRTLDPKAALEAGADVLVVGRPVTAAADPRAAVRALLDSLA